MHFVVAQINQSIVGMKAIDHKKEVENVVMRLVRGLADQGLKGALVEVEAELALEKRREAEAVKAREELVEAKKRTVKTYKALIDFIAKQA